ncbi:hypothetical protein L6R46_18745 [Myxococcota bacterium]|nr:hypothetical protein [Myxococcota bacterium]
MEKSVTRWRSPALNREMPLATWGFYGKPVLIFPTAGGDFEECERFLMLRMLQPLVDAGKIKVYACGSISGEGWLSSEAAPAYKSLLQARFDEYLVNELLPHIRKDCGGAESPKIAVTGASIGAYNAVNAAAKHPEHIDLCVAMSGTYYFDRWMSGHNDANYYFNSPVQFLPGVQPGAQLDALRQSFFLIASGRGRYEAPAESEKLCAILGSKGIPNRLELWGEDAHHDWPTWRTMLPMFLDKLTR